MPVGLPCRQTLTLILVISTLSLPDSRLQAAGEYDVVIYGGTAAGIAAAVQVRRMGRTVVVLEPGQRIGGLTTGGLGQTDIGNKSAIGGISREFYQRIRKHYQQSTAWKWQQPEDYRSGGQSRTGTNEDAMWTFEPSAALAVLKGLVEQYGIPVRYNQRLDRTPIDDGPRVLGAHLHGNRLISVLTTNGENYRGRLFIDATYEGDLMAGAGVQYTVGRESNQKYAETLNGVQTRRNLSHQFQSGVDPWLIAGDRGSGLLPGIDPTGPGTEGQGDHRVQAYCFRMCLTDHPGNRIPFVKPKTYDERRYELLFRNFEAGAQIIPWSNSAMPNRKTDVNNNRGFSTDFIGENYDYPDAGYEQRERIVERHRAYQQGLMWTLANHPRIPEAVRMEVSRWGTCRDEFDRDDGWQQQLYIREARRMVGEYVMTQHNCQGRIKAEQPIGLAAYTMDSHNVQRFVDEAGHVRNEGDVQVGGFSPYPIDYRSLLPREKECGNLLVPVCLSSTHMAFGSIRMEPVFMALGQSAATAAVLSLETGRPLHRLKYTTLRDRLLADKQVLSWTGPTKPVVESIPVKSLQGIVIDDAGLKTEGFESYSNSVGPYIGIGYRHDRNTAKGRQRVPVSVMIPEAGKYEVKLAWTSHPNRASNVPVTVGHAGGSSKVLVNQRKKPDKGAFGTIGSWFFDAGETEILISNEATDGYVIFDAVQLVRTRSNTPPRTDKQR